MDLTALQVLPAINLSQESWVNRTFDHSYWSALVALVALLISLASVLERRRNRRRAQAVLVVAWCERSWTEYARGIVEDDPTYLYLHNTSDLPVRGVEVWLKWNAGFDGEAGESRIHHAPRLLPPLTEPRLIDLHRSTGPWTSFSFGEDARVDVRIRFRDAADRMWVRDWAGRLHREDVWWQATKRRITNGVLYVFSQLLRLRERASGHRL